MQNKDRVGKSYRVNGPEWVTEVVAHHRYDPGSAEAAQRLAVFMFSTSLRNVQSVAYVSLYAVGELKQILST